MGEWLGWVDAFVSPREYPGTHPLLRLFLVSFTALFTEIMLIRWIGTEVRVFAFFQNLALIACFLGFGLGCYRSKRRLSLLLSLLSMTLLVFLVHLPLPIWKALLTGLSLSLSTWSDAALWGAGLPKGLVGFETAGLLYATSVVILAILLVLLVGVMVPLGQRVGHLLDTASSPVTAYSVNLLGSVAGIWAFAGLAFLWLSPQYWFSMAFLGLGFLVVRLPRLMAAAAALLVLCLFLLGLGGRGYTQVQWSPYQKLQVQALGDRQYNILVNNTGYMTISNTTSEFLARKPEVASVYRDTSSYDAPFRFAEHTDRVLIVGAGAGNDAAGALRHGARQVDAVEIDPVIYGLGKRLHPDRPYDSHCVNVIVNDARAFLRQARQPYDVVVFGLLDSHTQFSDFSNMRIDNYVYTEEALGEAGRLLKPGGILVVKFEVRDPWAWIGQRIYGMLEQVFGKPPIVFRAPPVGALLPATVFITSQDSGLYARALAPPLAKLVEEHPPIFTRDAGSSPPPATDDWPYVYHRSHTIPRTYLTVTLVLLAMSLLMVRGTFEPRRQDSWCFFSLGAGFLLLETQLVSRLALYFGTTWLVNCIAITALLLVLTVSNFYVVRFHPTRLAPFFVLLLASLVANYLFPWERLPYAAHAVGVMLSGAYAVPVFFAGVIFAELFRRSEVKSSAFGANIVGSVAGGLTQNISFIFGMKMLLLVAALFYAAAAFCGGRAELSPPGA